MAYTHLGLTLDEWRTAGQHKLVAQRARALRYMALYDGEPVGTALTGRSRELFRRLLRESRTNWAELVVNAVAERLYVAGFTFGDDAINDLAWRIWQASYMDADGEMVQSDSLVCAHTFVSVWPDDTNPTGVTIWPEHPTEVAAFYKPGERRRPVAVFKQVGGTRADVVAINSGSTVDAVVLPDVVATWDRDGLTVEPNPTGVVPYREVVPQPSTVRLPRSELHAVEMPQRRINTTVYNRLVATDFDAFRQITATGIQVEKTTSGLWVPPFNVGSDRLLWSENPDAKFSAIPGSALTGYLEAVQADVMHVSAVTQTPPHYLLGQIVNISGEALKAAEAGLVSKVRRRASHIGEAWEDIMRLALGMVGNVGAVDYTAEVIWRDFEYRSEGELVGALATMASLGVPREKLWARWGASPQEINDWSATPPPEPVPVDTTE